MTDSPTVHGNHQMTEEWLIHLPCMFKRRVDDGSLVLWRTGITAWIIVWGDDHPTCRERLTRSQQFRWAGIVSPRKVASCPHCGTAIRPSAMATVKEMGWILLAMTVLFSLVWPQGYWSGLAIAGCLLLIMVAGANTRFEGVATRESPDRGSQ